MQVVLFHVPLKTEKQVAQLLRPYGISVRTISREQYTVPLGVLLGLRKAGACCHRWDWNLQSRCCSCTACRMTW